MELLPNVEEDKNLTVEFKDEEEDIKEQEEEDEEEPEPEPIVEEKQQIQVDEVFKKATSLVDNAPTIKKVKRTRKMTPEALEKLKVAREKALETRRKNAAARKEGTMKSKKQIQEDIVKEEKELKRPVINNITHETKNITNNFSEDDIKRIAAEASAQATADALAGYETVRKARKEEKKKKKEEENHRVAVKQTINRALSRNDDDFYANCF
jgi:hypothetical protein